MMEFVVERVNTLQGKEKMLLPEFSLYPKMFKPLTLSQTSPGFYMSALQDF